MVKADVLAALDAARGKYISGQELAQQLGVSRTAIWKAVDALRADGIPVAAVTNRGYILSPAADVLNTAAVTALLAPETAKALQVEVVDRLPGTNAALRARAEDGAPRGPGADRPGTIGWARPRRAQLLLAQGGLYLSILLRPEIGLRQAVRLTAMAAVAACRAAEKVSGAELRIKWVNDLWRDGRKVCGILTEAALDMESGMLDYAVLGLGFNITAPSDGWPAELQDVAGALFDDAPPPGARAALAAAFLNEFWALYHGVPKPEYLPEYRARQALLGQTVTVTPRNGTPRKAEALDIDEDCRLVVRFAGEHNLVPLRGEEVHLGKYL